MRYIIALLLFFVGCGDYEIRSKSDYARLQEDIKDLHKKVESQAELLQKEQTSSENGRYQLLIHPQIGRFHFLVDTKLGLVWNIQEDPTTNKNFFSSIGFNGGSQVPTVLNQLGDLVIPEKEIETIGVIAEYQTEARMREIKKQLNPKSVTPAVKATPLAPIKSNNAQ